VQTEIPEMILIGKSMKEESGCQNKVWEAFEYLIPPGVRVSGPSNRSGSKGFRIDWLTNRRHVLDMLGWYCMQVAEVLKGKPVSVSGRSRLKIYVSSHTSRSGNVKHFCIIWRCLTWKCFKNSRPIELKMSESLCSHPLENAEQFLSCLLWNCVRQFDSLMREPVKVSGMFTMTMPESFRSVWCDNMWAFLRWLIWQCADVLLLSDARVLQDLSIGRVGNCDRRLHWLIKVCGRASILFELKVPEVVLWGDFSLVSMWNLKICKNLCNVWHCYA
jgi:hypothetical protein